MADQQYLICDLRPDWSWRPYVTFWRPSNAGYAYPLPWSGDYTSAEVDAAGDYYTEIEGDELIRFAVPREAAEAIAGAPEPGRVDGDAGPVVVNSPKNQELLRAAAYIPQAFDRSTIQMAAAQ